MKDTELGRLVLKRIAAAPELFDMRTWGTDEPCGTIACLAGHTMLAAGYSFRLGTYYRLDGTEVDHNGLEAKKLLGMTDDEYMGPTGYSLFFMKNKKLALKRFREIIGNSEKE